MCWQQGAAATCCSSWACAVNRVASASHVLLCVSACRYFHKGSLAYVGGDQAVMDIPTVGPIFGRPAGFMWKGYETFAQVNASQTAVHCGCCMLTTLSWHNRCRAVRWWHLVNSGEVVTDMFRLCLLPSCRSASATSCWSQTIGEYVFV